MRMTVTLLVLLVSVGLCVATVGCGSREESEPAGLREPKVLSSSQEELLDIAFSAASAMPLEPHIKNRSRAQEVVVTALFELDQPEKARGNIEQIANWRRGAGYADLALCYARMGAKEKVEPCLALAAQAVAEAEDWRKDRIKAKIAAVRAYMGQPQVRTELGVSADEWGPVVRAEAIACSNETFDETMAALEKLASTENFSASQGAMGACVELYDRFYENAAHRDRAQRAIRAGWEQMPPFIYIDLLIELADASLDHDDQAKALDLVNEAQTLMDSAKWQPQTAIPLMARLAQRRFLAGDQDAANAQLQKAAELFDAKRETIVNIYRAGMLRPIAEAHHVMGDTAAALDFYKQAIEAGMENPNSRPRADDLVAICCSMALHAVEPDAALMARIQGIQAGLSDPW